MSRKSCGWWLAAGARGLLALAGVDSAAAAVDASRRPVRQWEPVDIELHPAKTHAWWDAPVRAVFEREPGGERLAVAGFWDGANRWVVRFAAPTPGTWTYRIESQDTALQGISGRLEAAAPNTAELRANSSLRGAIRIAASGRYFEHADGTPFLLLADTVWAVNTVRCGLGANDDGPFHQLLADRKAKGFTAILMQYFHGYGDYPDSPGHRNEGGPAFINRNLRQLNPAHFAALDRRMRALWEQGFVAAINTTWWGKTRDCIFSAGDAARIAAYCARRYGAFNALWSVSGEYQYVFKDCGWTAADLTRLGEAVQRHNPWQRPLSVHPSARLDWPPPHNVQSSRPFHAEPWLDHHWLQTGQSRDRLFNIVTRLRDDRGLRPAKPVFLSEAAYESVHDPESAYSARWQVWASFLNGAAGYGYGADGIWQFFDPTDPSGETGKNVKDVVPWRQALPLAGSGQVGHARTMLQELEWWRLEPQRDRIRVNGGPNALPTAVDLSPPHVAAIGDSVTLVYLPRGNASRSLQLAMPGPGAVHVRWFDPRTGRYAGEPMRMRSDGYLHIPARPSPAEEDWVMLVRGP